MASLRTPTASAVAGGADLTAVDAVLVAYLRGLRSTLATAAARSQATTDTLREAIAETDVQIAALAGDIDYDAVIAWATTAKRNRKHLKGEHP